MKTFLTLALVATLSAPAALEADDFADNGKDLFGLWCASCHGPGQHAPGTLALALKYEGELPAVLSERDDLDADVIAYFVRNGVSVMPSFRKTELSDADIQAIAAFINLPE